MTFKNWRTRFSWKLLMITTLQCVMLSSLLARTFYLDPVNGDISNDGSFSSPWSTLSDVIEANLIHSYSYAPLPYSSNSGLVDKNPSGPIAAGDTLMLREGLHGYIFLQNYINEFPIVIKRYEDETPILEGVNLQACKNWVFDGVDISSEPYEYYLNETLFFIESHGWQGPSSHIEVNNCKIYSTSTPWSTAQDWVDNVSSGLYINGDSCIARNNTIENINMGLICAGDYIVAEGNRIINFSGDGGRILGSYISFNYNLIKNNYKVDENHDDGIQSFAYDNVVDHNEVIGNIIINSDDENQVLAGSLQGIACFDGFFNDWFIANNIVSVDHWHGITLLGARRCTIVHNTVLDPSPNMTPGASWIQVDNHKDGTPSEDCLVANNVANQIMVDGVTINNTTLSSKSEYDEHFEDYSTYNFSLLPTSSLIDSADPAYSISYDFAQNLRDDRPDIGAYEYIESPNSVINSDDESHIIIYPNPMMNEVIITNLNSDDRVYCYRFDGELIFSCDQNEVNKNLSSVVNGSYLIFVRDKNHNVRTVQKVIKID